MGRHRRITIIRHGRTELTNEGRFTGHIDIPLSNEGEEEIKKSALSLSAYEPTQLISSDFLRAKNTANIIGDICSLSPFYDARLREEDLGGWSGLTHLEAMTRFPDEYDNWLRGNVLFCKGEREGLNAVAIRARQAVEESLQNNSIHSLLIVTHLNTSIALISSLLNLPPNKWLIFSDLKPARYASLILSSKNDWLLDAYNVY